uniref:Uncharacterized LOC100179636 n=1 Tax=Ciona intestinalis TaxID=7719 RepID=F6QZU2_CIOIN|nr:uncharacterized protein LOC100179636 [Ciona intestinalis]|eukprot:XP_002130877.1 uncharacterized protein LOC100179636 [Ciona intestinalis]
MVAEENPTGFRYLTTFQALFQIVELLLLMVVWALVASQKFLFIPGFAFSLGAFVTIWLITLLFFVLYIFGAHVKINQSLAKQNANTEEPSTSGTAGSLKPPPEVRLKIKKVVWFVTEYVIYFFCIIFLFIAVCIVTSKAYTNQHFIAAYAIGWIVLGFYILHFCLLVRNTEGKWPHQCLMECCGLIRKRKTEDTSQLLPTEQASPDNP